jgi:hypothetical protein
MRVLAPPPSVESWAVISNKVFYTFKFKLACKNSSGIEGSCSWRPEREVARDLAEVARLSEQGEGRSRRGARAGWRAWEGVGGSARATGSTRRRCGAPTAAASMSSTFGWLVGALTSVPGNIGACTGSLAACDSLRNDERQPLGPSGVGIGFAHDKAGVLRVDTLRRGAETSGVGSSPRPAARRRPRACGPPAGMPARSLSGLRLRAFCSRSCAPGTDARVLLPDPHGRYPRLR